MSPRAPRRPAGPSPLAEIGAAVKAAREARGLSLQALAKAARCAPHAVRRLESGRGAHLREVLRACEVLGLPFGLRPPSLSEDVIAAVVRYLGADWLLARPELTADETQWLAMIVAGELEHGRRYSVGGKLCVTVYAGTARDELVALREELPRGGADAAGAQWLAMIVAGELKYGRRHTVDGKLRTEPWRGPARGELEALQKKLRAMAPKKGPKQP